MRTRTNQSGFSFLELLLVVVVLGAVAVVGLRIYDNRQTNDTSSTSKTVNNSPAATDVKPAPEINDTKDLDAAETTLDQTDPENSNTADSSQLTSQSSSF